MRINKEIPLLTVYSPNRKDILCSVAQPKHAKITYNFNSCSTLQFQVDKNIFDSKTGKWIENPCYNDLAENNLLYMANASNVLNYNGAPLLPDGSYQLIADENQSSKKTYQGNYLPYVYRYSPAFVNNNITLQTEDTLFDVSATAGYPFIQYYTIMYRNNRNYNRYVTTGAGFKYYMNATEMMVEQFFPAKVGDVIFLGSKTNNNMAFAGDDGGGTALYGYTLFFYSGDSADKCEKYGQTSTPNNLHWDKTYYNPTIRYRIKDGDFGYYTYEEADGTIKRSYRKEGYIRICGETGGSLPVAGFTYILSGERKVSNIKIGTKTNHQHSIPWFVIQDVQEVKDGRGVHKTVTAYSYEYTLSKHYFSVDESALPLYIPDEVIDQVTSDNWIIDKWENQNGDITYNRGYQYMRRGIINQILDYLPEWRIGYVSNSALLTKYRPIPKADNVNIYSYLMNEIQKLYGCYVIFNTEDKTINLIEQSDIFMFNAGTVISWRNALKALTISNQNTKYITAMRVNTDSETFGISMVNPNGTNVIYNFDSVIDKLDYSVDNTHINPDTNNPYTLKELMIKYKADYAAQLSTYRSYGKSLIEATRKLADDERLLKQSLENYKKTVAACKPSTNNNAIPDIPQAKYQFETDGLYEPTTYNINNKYGSQELFNDVKAANTAYWDFFDTYEATQKNVAKYSAKMRAIALEFSFNIKTLTTEYANGIENYTPLFTPSEMKELQNFIVEGDWESSVITFDDNFKPNEIYNSLVDMFNTAKTEMDNIYSKPIYEFSAEIADIFRMKETRAACDSICLGNSLYIADGDNWITPILLQVNVDFDNMNGTTMLFSTDYKRKPLEYRFSKLFATIQQTSVSTPKYTFD